MIPQIELQCWLVLAASVITGSSAVLALIADRYEESLLENLALVAVAFSGFIVTMQIFVHAFAQMSGITLLACSTACYAVTRVLKKHNELYKDAT
jgi:hypothetical protein